MKRFFLSLSFLFSTFSYSQNMLSNNQNVLSVDQMIELNRLSGNQLSADNAYILFTMSKVNILKNKSQTGIYVYNLKTKSYAPIANSTGISYGDAQWGSGNTIWYLSNENKEEGMQVWKMDVDGKNKIQVTHEKEGIDGFKISKDSKLMVLIIDQKQEKSVIDEYPEFKENQVRIIDDLMYRHWDQWSDDKYKQLYFCHVNSDNTLTEKNAIAPVNNIDKVNPPFGGSESISISPDNSMIYYSYKNKRGKEFALSTNTDIYSYNVKTKEINNISEANKGYDNRPTVSADGKYVVWLQMKHDGYESDKNDLVRYNVKTKTLTNLTEDLDLTVEDYAVTDEKAYLIIPFKGCNQLFELDLKTKKLTQLTHTIADYVGLSVGKDKIIATRQSMIEPTDLYEIDIPTKKATQLTSVNQDVLQNLSKPTIEEKWVKTTDGKDMLVWYILPPNFDSTQKYPTLLYCQGGPQGMVSQFFSYRWNFMLMASQGYVVVAPNRRGLPGFGVKWNEEISKDWGGQAIKDYLSATDDAAKRSFVDKERMGAVGASYGGFSVYFLAGIHQHRFKTFIAHDGLFNLESWYGTTEELFFANWDNKGPYWLPENKEYYQKTSPSNYVQNWDTPILIIQGEQDFRVPPDQGLQAFQVAQLKGIKSKLLYFKNEGHWVLMPQNAAIWHREFFKWLKETL